MDYAVVYITCVGCGDVHIPRKRIWVSRCRDNLKTTVNFRCMHCGTWNSEECTYGVFQALERVGVYIHEWSLPDELNDPVRSIKEPFDPDECIDFYRSLPNLEAEVANL